MELRRLDVFFYGLFMDTELLEAKGVHPVDARLLQYRGSGFGSERGLPSCPDRAERFTACS
jgi:hypothetical protein